MSPVPRELPWEKGVRYARAMREKLGVSRGKVESKFLGFVLGLSLDEIDTSPKSPLVGGSRVSDDKYRLVLRGKRPTSKRFGVARVLGAAALLDESFIPVAETTTSLQKYERAFAQEFLCPWEELDAFTDTEGTDEDGIADAAEYFQVSEWLIRTTLVNRGKLQRDRLPMFGAA